MSIGTDGMCCPSKSVLRSKKGADMSTKKKIILLVAAICYTCVLYGFLIGNSMFMMVTVILYAVLMLVFSLLADAGDPETVEKNRRQLEEAEGRNKELDEKVHELTAEKERYAKAMEEAATAKEEAIAGQQELLVRQEELNEALSKAEEVKSRFEEREKELLSNFLPPVGEGEQPNETIDIIQIARDTMQELKPFAEKVHLEIRISAPDDKILVRADASRLRIMFRNIIDNSIKYMNRAGILVITISNLGDDIFIVLKDNGNGLSEKETAHIFELNYQGSNRISGNGLGLTQAKAIVEYYGGTIYAKSNVGKGMGIYVQLPTD